uniref:SH2 domain-containing protein n=1 Tax=Panagrolaimus sp. JU765 TaxID=591449 RepID=A0AC34QN98_9BILA
MILQKYLKFVFGIEENMLSSGRSQHIVCCRHGIACDAGVNRSRKAKAETRSKQAKERDAQTPSTESLSDASTTYATVDGAVPLVDAPMDMSVPLEEAMANRVYSLSNVLGQLELNRILPITSYGKGLTQSQVLSKQREVLLRQNLYSRFFLGCKTMKEAEASVQRRTSFRLYYLLRQNAAELVEDMSEDIDNFLTPSLLLYIVYRCSNGAYRHYKVTTSKDPTGDTWYQVECGDPNAKAFRSIYRLVSYYSEFATIPVSKGHRVDVFPYWKSELGSKETASQRDS